MRNWRQVLYIDQTTGQIESITRPHPSVTITDETIDGGYFVKIIDPPVPNADLRNKYWDFDAGALTVRPPRPGEYYYWENKQWNLDKPALVTILKRMRTEKLRAIDWTQLPDVQLTPAKVQEYKDYRQELRDLPSLYPNITHIDEVVWPSPPA